MQATSAGVPAFALPTGDTKVHKGGRETPAALSAGVCCLL